MAPSAAPVAVPNKFRQYTSQPKPGHSNAPASPRLQPAARSTPRAAPAAPPAPARVQVPVAPITTAPSASPAAHPISPPMRYVVRVRGAEVTHDLKVEWEITRLQAQSKAYPILSALEQRGYIIRKTYDADERPVPVGLPTIVGFHAEPPAGGYARWVDIEAHTVADILEFGLATEKEVPLPADTPRPG